jgi:hypothetical protein
MTELKPETVQRIKEIYYGDCEDIDTQIIWIIGRLVDFEKTVMGDMRNMTEENHRLKYVIMEQIYGPDAVDFERFDICTETFDEKLAEEIWNELRDKNKNVIIQIYFVDCDKTESVYKYVGEKYM